MTPQLPTRRWNPIVHRALLDMVREERSDRPVATLDWDNTCIGGDIGEAMLVALDAADGGERMATYERALTERGKVYAYTFCATVLEGHTEQELSALAGRVFDEEIARGRIAIRPEMQDLLALLESCGWEVWIVSATAEIVVRVAAGRYGIPPERVIGVRLAVETDGRLAPRLTAPLTYREGKVTAIDANIGRRPTFAAGDADIDIEMLQSATYRLVIDRGIPELAARAEAGRWWRQTAWSPP